MNEERYKQIKDSIELQSLVKKQMGVEDELLQEEIELLKAYEQLKDLIDTILNFSLFKEECPLNFSFEDNSKEDEAQNIFYDDEYCENNCNDIYKDCWLKYFKKLEGSDSNE